VSSKSFWPDLLAIPEDQWDELGLEEKTSKGFEALLHRREEIVNRVCGLYQQHLHGELIQYGFFVPIAHRPLSVLPELSKLVQCGNPLAIRDFLCKQLREELARDHFFSIRKRWFQNRFFEKRQHVLKRGLEAHLQGDFISSIPVLLPQVEGVMADFLSETGVFEKKPDDCKKALNLMKKVLVEVDGQMIFTRGDKEVFQKFCDKKGIFDPRPDKDVFLNRGAILHGECLTYDKEEWSAQLIYFLDFLCDFTSCGWDQGVLPDGSPTIQLRKNSENKE
jgi:hypothetical protein